MSLLVGLETTQGTVLVNENGGFYLAGKKYGVLDQLRVATKYHQIIEEKGKCTCRALAEATNTSRKFTNKIINELKKNNGCLDCVLEHKKNRPQKKGKRRTSYGSRTFDVADEIVLLKLREEQPTRTLASYQRHLFHQTGTFASISLIASWFLYNFDYRGSMVKTSMVPVDKLRPDNILRYLEYTQIIKGMDVSRIKFGDEKHLKGAELFNKKVRKCPITGRVEAILVDSDFRNTYTIIGFCGISGNFPFDHYIHDSTNDARTFCWAVEAAIFKGFLLPGDILVLDNASIHRFRDSVNLEDWLYDNYNILLLFLPARSPELNPIELLWNFLVQRLKIYNLGLPRRTGNAVAFAASDIMNKFTFEDVVKVYKSAGYIN
eukprot:CAMPEP_0178958698 /NCGR_PEP_ID=MMETSP0789-20121207/11798_1 /TAXON_ID=3005 /ORGANISM="Rhizosolenia setigera, Strain CCMP 1694" /LENGTH=376 /DNA_ID=CAMNT_0020641455 /DNA_START=63 /DNA_END=1193 /DNA_ORIENTATION=+